MALSKRHQQFINEYFLCNMNATRAYLKIYPDSSYDAARANAARLIATDNVSAAIAEQLKEKQMSAEEALARLADMAAASHGDFADVQLRDDLKDHPKAHLVKTVVTDTFEDAKGKLHHKLRLELYDAQRAIEDILKIHGKFKETTTNLNIDLSNCTNEQLQRIAAGEDPTHVIATTQSGG